MRTDRFGKNRQHDIAQRPSPPGGIGIWRAIVGDGLEGEAAAWLQRLETAGEEPSVGVHTLHGGRAISREVFKRSKRNDRIIGIRRNVIGPALQTDVRVSNGSRQEEVALRDTQRQTDGPTE